MFLSPHRRAVQLDEPGLERVLRLRDVRADQCLARRVGQREGFVE